MALNRCGMTEERQGFYPYLIREAVWANPSLRFAKHRPVSDPEASEVSSAKQVLHSMYCPVMQGAAPDRAAANT